VSKTDDFINDEIQRLTARCKELTSLTSEITMKMLSKERTPGLGAKLLTSISRAASDCRDILQAHGDEDPFPLRLRSAIAETQQEISSTADAFAAFMMMPPN
jgi:hypothetical protein